MTGHGRRLALAVLAGTFLLQLAWVIAIPAYRGMDEFNHVYRADSVAHGHWTAVPQPAGYHGRGDLVRVDLATVRAAYPVCHSYRYIADADCRAAAAYPDGTGLVASGAARYNPAFYWLIGQPTRWLGPVASLYAMRVLDALLCSVLLAIAAWATTLWARTGWPLLGVLLTCTPMAMDSGAVPAPNGPEMFAGIALWSLLLAMSRLAPEDRRVRSLLVAAVPAAVVLVGVRALGPLWLLLVVLSAILVIGPRTMVRIVTCHPRVVACATVVVGLAGLAAVWWTRSAGTNSLAAEADRHAPSPIVSSLRMLPVWLFQSIGAFPDKFDQAPGPVYGAGLVLLGGLLVVAMRRARTAGRLQLLVVGLVAVGVPLLISCVTYAQLGPVWQGRYAWPYAAGALVLAGVLLDRHPPAIRRPALVACVLVLGLLLHVPGPLSVMPHDGGAAAWSDPRRWLVVALVVAALGAWAGAAASLRRTARPDTPMSAPDLPAQAEVRDPAAVLPSMVAP